MDVHVHRLGRAGDEERRGRVAVAGEHVGIGGAQRPEQQLVADRAVVDEEVLGDRRAAREGRERREAAEPDAVALGVDREGVGHEIRTEERAQPAAEGVEEVARLGVEPQDLARGLGVAAVGEGEADGGRGHRQPPHDVGDRLRLGAVGAEELEPRRGRREERLDLDHGPAGQRRRPERRDVAPAHGDRRGLGAHRQLREVSVSRPTAPSEGRASPRKPKVRMRVRSVPSIFEVAWRSSARRSSVRRNAVAVVLDPDQPLAAVGEGDVDPPGAGVERILDELLHRRGRPLDHLAGGDPVRRGRIELPDRPSSRYVGCLGVHTPRSSTGRADGATG